MMSTTHTHTDTHTHTQLLPEGADLLLPGLLGQVLSVLTGEGPGVAHEGTGQGHIPRQGPQLSLQAHNAHLPPGPLASQPCMYCTTFSSLNILMMLVPKHSNRARALCAALIRCEGRNTDRADA